MRENMKKRGKFIVIDGLDGCGKGTQLQMLRKKFGDDVAVFTREPGGSPFAEVIRKVVLSDDASQSGALTQFFLFLAARSDHMEKVVIPAIKKGKHVISDRGDSSTWAFQICGKENALLRKYFEKTRKWLFEDGKPDRYIVLDLEPKVAYERMRNDDSRARNHFDDQEISYHERVRAGFLEFAEKHPVSIVNADRGAEEVHKDICAIIEKVLKE
jgi:dTMP kinase